MEHNTFIQEIAHKSPIGGMVLVIASIATAELTPFTGLPDAVIFVGRLASYALASWGSIELIRYYRAKRKSLK